MACFSNKSAWLPCCAKLQMPGKIIIYRLWSVKFGWLLYVAASSICVLYFFFPNKVRVVSKYSGKYQMFGICSPLKASVRFLKHSVSLNIFVSYSCTPKEE